METITRTGETDQGVTEDELPVVAGVVKTSDSEPHPEGHAKDE